LRERRRSKTGALCCGPLESHACKFVCSFELMQLRQYFNYKWYYKNRLMYSPCGNKMPNRCKRCFYCFLNMFQAPLCPSSGAREYYTAGCCLWCLVLWFSSCRYGVELRVMCPVRGLQQQSANRTHNPQQPTV